VSAPTTLVLVGPMGAGKSSVGKELARRLGGMVLDTDEHVENQTTTSVAEIFAAQGEETFRRYELVALEHAIVARYLVVATGGGIVTTQEALEILKHHHGVVFLDVSLEVALDRVRGDDHVRPLLSGDDEAAMKAIMDQRRPLYEEAADLTVVTNNRSIEQITDAIMTWVSDQ